VFFAVLGGVGVGGGGVWSLCVYVWCVCGVCGILVCMCVSGVVGLATYWYYVFFILAVVSVGQG